ncbi:hypothetical protein [Aestuariivirga sp.]|uniref:hypothetical protein n=1 Tax=Aestuariivirga sp. TaxID=2650926 RepID=UPI0025C32CF6|nr:hypothetical protein [Aestuariivirga sp.]
MLNSLLPEDLDILVKAHLYQKFPGEFDSDHQAREFADFIIRAVKRRRLTGPEIAAIVDERAVNDGTIAHAAARLADLLGDSYSVEAIKQNHARYGKRHLELQKSRSRLDNQIAEMESKLSDSDRKHLKEFGSTIADLLGRPDIKKRLEDFRRERNDIISDSVIDLD